MSVPLSFLHLVSRSSVCPWSLLHSQRRPMRPSLHLRQKTVFPYYKGIFSEIILVEGSPPQIVGYAREGPVFFPRTSIKCNWTSATTDGSSVLSVRVWAGSCYWLHEPNKWRHHFHMVTTSYINKPLDCFSLKTWKLLSTIIQMNALPILLTKEKCQQWLFVVS